MFCWCEWGISITQLMHFPVREGKSNMGIIWNAPIELCTAHLKKNQTYSIKRTGIMQRNKKLVGKARKTWSVCDITLNLADKSEQEASNLLAQTELVPKLKDFFLAPK